MEHTPGAVKGYSATIDELVRRMAEVMRIHPSARNVDSPFELFKYGLDVDGIEPTLAQAQGALGAARRIVRDEPR